MSEINLTKYIFSFSILIDSSIIPEINQFSG